MPELVAVITRTRDRPRFLRRAIRSVAQQSFGRWRHYVVNDGGDRSAVDAVVSAAGGGDRIEVLHLASRAGMEGATNRALERIDSRWVALLDDDDSWHEDFLETAVRALEQRCSSTLRGVVVRSLVVEERLDGEALIEVRRAPFNDHLVALSLERLACENQFTNNAFLFERDALEVVGAFCEELPVYGDWDFNLRFLQAFDVSVVPSALACYHRRVSGVLAHQNSFVQDPTVARRARAQLTNLWLRGAGGRSPQLGMLMALGSELSRQQAVLDRMDKYFNALHRLRRLPILRGLDRVMSANRTSKH